MSNLESGKKIRIEDKEFVVKSVTDSTVTGERVIQVHLMYKEPRDAKPGFKTSVVGNALQSDFTRLSKEFEPIAQELVKGLEEIASTFEKAANNAR